MTTQTLIVHGDDLKTAEKIALNLTGELESRKNHIRVHTKINFEIENLRSNNICLLYTSPSPRDQRGSRMPSSA